jgi:hypothetical protein
MRTIIAVLSIVVGISNAAYLGIPPISTLSFAPVRLAGWESHDYSPTNVKLEATGAALMWGGTITALTVLPWIKEPQQHKWYIPIACAYLGGTALYLTGRFMARR